MLLSEVLHIAKELKSFNPINESYKANIIKLLINPINLYTTFNVQGKVLDRDELYYRYYSLINSSCISDYFNNPDGRKYVLNQNIYKNNITFINTINLQLKNNTDTQIDIANISDDLIEVINDITLAKKKPYKSCLLFWVNSSYNELIAITYNNKIICVCKHYIGNSQNIILNNKSFVGNYTEEECKKMIESYTKDNDYTEMNKFISKAYKELKYVSIYNSEKSIKQELETVALSINKLIEYFNNNGIYNITIYAVNSAGMEENNITEKMDLRQQYKIFRYEQNYFLLRLRERYKKYVQELKGKKEKNNKQGNVKKLFHLCLESYQKCIDVYTEYLTKPIEDLKLESTHYDRYSIHLSKAFQHILYPYLQKNPNNGSYMYNTLISKFLYSYKKKIDWKSYTTNTKIDIILFCSIYISLYIDILSNILKLYTEIDDITDTNTVTMKLAEVKRCYQYISNLQKDNDTTQQCKKRLNDEHIPEIEHLLDNIINFNI